MKGIYIAYDMKDFEQIIRIGTIKEIAEQLQRSPASIASQMSRGHLIRRRYKVVKVGEE